MTTTRQHPFPAINPMVNRDIPSRQAPVSFVPAFYTVAEAALLLRVCTKTIRRRIKTLDIRKASLGGRVVRIAAQEMARLAAGEDWSAPPEGPV
jgi:hypothetical protein